MNNLLSIVWTSKISISISCNQVVAPSGGYVRKLKKNIPISIGNIARCVTRSGYLTYMAWKATGRVTIKCNKICGQDISVAMATNQTLRKSQ